MSGLISRQAAIDAFAKEYEDFTKEVGHDVRIEKTHKAIITLIEQLPSAQTERKGRWMRYGEDGYPNEKDTVVWQCDQCLTTYYGRTERIANYCPNCGCRMTEGAEE